MDKFNKLVVLDTCVNGDENNLKELIGNRYDHLDKCYNICKKYLPPQLITNIEYNIQDDSSSTFNITMSDNNCISDNILEDGMNINKTDKGCQINIPIRRSWLIYECMVIGLWQVL